MQVWPMHNPAAWQGEPGHAAPSPTVTCLHLPTRQMSAVTQSAGPHAVPSTASVKPQPVAGSQIGTLQGSVDEPHLALEANCTQPVEASQASVVHASWSSHCFTSPT